MGKVFSGTPKIEVSKVDTAAEAERNAEAERQKALERQRRGLDSTIRTSYTGILDPQNMDLKRKKLLGE